jgi:AraC-like DNA-binding protein
MELLHTKVDRGRIPGCATGESWPVLCDHEATRSSAAVLSPPSEWKLALQHLIELSREQVPVPSWWPLRTGYVGGIQTVTYAGGSRWDSKSCLDVRNDAVLYFQLTMAGWGCFQLADQSLQRARPGNAFFSTTPGRDHCYAPEQSPGWTFGWIGLHHPYLVARVAKLLAVTGPRLDVSPDSRLVVAALRLIRGAIKRDFSDAFEVELELFRFVQACERSALTAPSGMTGRERLLDDVRARVVSSLPKAIAVDALAAGHGMSRSHFSRFFRSRTGMTPAHFATEVRVHEAARMLLDTREPLKRIADACGFANANHFGKVFRRFCHLSPKAYRQAR